MRKIVIGSRESKLAMVQSKLVIDELEKHHNDIEFKLLTMKTTGDIILDKTLDKIGGKGLFVKELDKALMEKRSDLSIHSLKDMPMEENEKLPILAYFKREDPRDVLILPKNVKELDNDKPIGCSSLRRINQLVKLFPKSTFKSVRGNVITRLEKLDRGEYSALVLAFAGIKRLGLEERISRIFEVSEIIPSAGQGILAVQGRKDENKDLLICVDDKNARIAGIAERAFVRELNGGCSLPIAAYAFTKKDTINLTGYYCVESSKNKENDNMKETNGIEVIKNKTVSTKGLKFYEIEKLAQQLGTDLAKEIR